MRELEISIIMAVYNGSKYLPQAIESILDQTFCGFEFIIVDDGSKDETFSTCQKYARQDRRVKFLRNEQNRGFTYSLNKALGIASGKYIARMDADDVSHPKRLEIQIKFMETHPEIGLLGTFYNELDHAGKVSDRVVKFPTEPIIIKWQLCFENPVPHPPIIMRKELVDRLGGYGEQWVTTQDYDLFTRLSKITRLANYPEVLFHWRIHEDSISTTLNEEQRRNALQISHAFVSDLLGEDVSMNAINLLWKRQGRSISEALQRSQILYRLCLAILQEQQWTNTEKVALRRHVARKLYYHLRPYSDRNRKWQLLPRLFWLSPPTFLNLLNDRVKNYSLKQHDTNRILQSV